MLEHIFSGLPLPLNVVLALGALYVVTRSAHYMVDGAVHLAHELHVSPLVIGATVIAMGTTSAELAVNLSIVFTGGDTSAIIGNILGSNLVNFGLGLGIPALMTGLIVVPRAVFESNIPLYLATTGLATTFLFDRQIGRLEAGLLLATFAAVLYLIVQQARARHRGSLLLVEVTEIEAIAHPAALYMTRTQALLALFGGLAVLVAASRLLILNMAVLAVALHVPQFAIGLIIIGPGTSMPEIASAIQATRRGHPELVLGAAVGANLLNLSSGLGVPALIRPLAAGQTAVATFVFLNFLNLSLLILLLLDLEWLGQSRTLNRVIGTYLVAIYAGFIAFETVIAAGGTPAQGEIAIAAVAMLGGLLLAARKAIARVVRPAPPAGEAAKTGGRVLCATRGGKASQPTHREAIAIAKELGAELLFLYVFDRSILQRVATPIVINVEEQVKYMLAYLQRTAQEQARQAGVQASVLVRTGSLRDEIQAVVSELDITLIVLGRSGKESPTFVDGALEGLAAEVEEATGIPVLVVEGRGAVRRGRRAVRQTGADGSERQRAPETLLRRETMTDGVRVGEVTHFFNRLCVAVVRASQDIKVGDMVHFLGHSTDFYQTITSMEIDHQPVTEVKAGQEVAIKVERRVRGGDAVFRLSGEE